MSHEIRDITIIGAGPTGLFGLFYAGMREVSAQIVDALPEAGGQLTALYPEKYIFDVAGIPTILAKDLVKQLVDQERRLGQPIHPRHKGIRLDQRDDHFLLVTDHHEVPTRAIWIPARVGDVSLRRVP